MTSIRLSPLPAPGARAWRWAAAFRMLLLLLAAGALVSASAGSLGEPGGAAHDVVYTCPMHPQVREADPGHCPICHMALEPVRRSASAPAAPDTVALRNLEAHGYVVDVVRARSLLFRSRELRGPAQVEGDGTLSAVFYTDQLPSIGEGASGLFTSSHDPSVTVAVSRTARPAIRWDGSTSRISFRTSRPIAPGQVGWIELPRMPRNVLEVPASAVLESSDGPYVLVPRGAGFERRNVEIGETFAGLEYAVVLSGLRVQDRVVARASFFLDAERRLDAASGGPDGGAR